MTILILTISHLACMLIAYIFAIRRGFNIGTLNTLNRLEKLKQFCLNNPNASQKDCEDYMRTLK